MLYVPNADPLQSIDRATSILAWALRMACSMGHKLYMLLISKITSRAGSSKIQQTTSPFNVNPTT
jgi:hypothetical protein